MDGWEREHNSITNKCVLVQT